MPDSESGYGASPQGALRSTSDSVSPLVGPEVRVLPLDVSLLRPDSSQERRRRLDGRIAAWERHPWRKALGEGLLVGIACGIGQAVGWGGITYLTFVTAAGVFIFNVAYLRYGMAERLKERRRRQFPQHESPAEHS